MLLLLFSLINSGFSFIANYILRLSALELSPAFIIILANQGNNVILSSIMLVLAYDIISPKDFRYIWFKLPVTILIGYLAISIASPLLLVLIYHLIIVVLALSMGFLNGRYIMFAVVNFFVNVVVARIYYLF